jgi:hypothetical protein
MANLSLSVEPGYYLEAQHANWVLSSEVDFISFALNGAQPALSKYIAYDTLNPANPFIAVTEDGTGRVVYDGGFPKFYNTFAPAAGLDPLFSLEFRGTTAGNTSGTNFFYYDMFCDTKVTIAAGDKLVYDIWTNDANARVGLDGVTANDPATFRYALRDWIDQTNRIKDQNGLGCHPATDLSAYALNKWYHREFDLTLCAGYRFDKWSLAYEGEKAGTFYTRFKEVYILDKNGKVKATLFKDKILIANSANIEGGASGYTNISKTIYDPRSHLNAAFKYLFNAIRWVSKTSMLEAGVKKILILGDSSGASNYKVKGTASTDFFTSLTNLCTAVGFTPTFKDVTDYAGGLLNATLAEMNQYDCVLLMGSQSGTGALITTSMIQDIQTYRQQGGGIIMITDHGNDVPNIGAAYPPSTSTAFFHMVNAVAVNFGAWFSGNFDRVPVNVGFLRTNYGDHPLYDGMENTESIAAGGSESKVIITNPPQYRDPVPPIDISKQGVNTVKVMALLKNGTMEAYSFVYVIATGQLLKFLDPDGVEINALPASFSSKVDFNVEVVGAGLGTIQGDIQLNGKTVGKLAYSDSEGSSQAWMAGGSNQLFVNKGDVFTARITSPFQFTRNLPVNRYQPNLTGLVTVPAVVKAMRADGFGTTEHNKVVNAGIRQMNLEYSHLQYLPKGDYARDIIQLRSFFGSQLEKPGQQVYIYQTLAQAQEAMGRLTPPSARDVFNTWDRFTNNEYFVGGVGATGDAAAWQWNDALGAAVQPLNTATWNGFISPDVVDNYELDVVIKSDNADDDSNGLVLALNRDGGINHRLIVALNQGGNSPAASHSIGIYSGATTQHLVLNDFAGRKSNAAFPTDGGWRGKFSRVKVTRSGNYFKVLASQWNSLILDPASLMELTLNDTALQAQFKGAKPWGFINLSQAQSYFTLRGYKGGPLKDVVVVGATGAVYYYTNGGWALIPGTTAKDVFGYPRKLTNPETGASFMVNANGTITAL